MRRAIGLLCDLSDLFIRLAGSALFVVMIVTVFYEVVMRYVFSSPTFWSEAVARNSMIWIVVLGLALGIRRKDNVRVDFVVFLLPDTLQAFLGWVRLILVTIFAVIFLYFGTQLALANLSQTVTGLGIPVFWIYLCVPLSGLFMLLFLAEAMLAQDTEVF